jgi:molybdenum cofactor synthesis domain-containing protein
MAKTAGLIIIGNEILSAKVQDANAPFFARALRELGVDLRRIAVVPDEVEVIAAEVRAFSRAFDVVCTSGGVGPTHDDVTIEAVAHAFGRRVVRDPGLERVLRDFYRNRVTEAHLKMAEVPEGAELAGRETLLFPVIACRNVYIFPGIPEILRQKFHAIQERFRDTPFHLTKVYVNMDEGDLADALNVLVREFPALQLGSYPELNAPGYKVKVTIEAKERGPVEGAVARLQALLPGRAIVRVEG